MGMLAAKLGKAQGIAHNYARTFPCITNTSRQLLWPEWGISNHRGSSAMADDTPADYDSPWKEALALYFREFLQLLQPGLHHQIDWSVAPVFLDKELQAISRDAANGRRLADKLVLVRLTRIEAPELWLLIHIEVQAGRITRRGLQDMARRMYQYSYRIEDQFLIGGDEARSGTIPRRPGLARADALPEDPAINDPASRQHLKDGRPADLTGLCILTARASGPPVLTHTRGFGNYGVKFTCPVLYLEQWLNRWDELEASARTNPFAVVVMAQLMAQKTHGKGMQRLVSKTQVASLLYKYGYARQHIEALLHIIDWMMALPAALEPLFAQALGKIEREYNMAFVTSFERMGIQKGLAQGLEQGLQQGKLEGRIEGRLEGEADLLLRQITRKFGHVPKAARQRIQTATSAQLETWSLNILDAQTLDEVFLDGYQG